MQEYYITNLYCAGYLYNKGIRPVRIIRNHEGKRMIFYENNEQLHTAIDEFYSNSNLISFVKAVLEVKREVYKN